MLDQVTEKFGQWASYWSSRAEQALNEVSIRVAVTGLSRAGKTVFITSLIHNLLALGQRRNTLPRLHSALSVNGTSRLREVRIAREGSATIPRFDFAGKLADLSASKPFWPARTDDIAQIALEMEIEWENTLAQKLGPWRLRLELLDYPGEWLLDLPLLSQSYRSWSEQTLSLMRKPPRLSVCSEFLQFLTTIDPDAPVDEAIIRRGHTLYRTALHDCRARLGLRYLQPGGFLCPGPRGEAPYLWFFPVDHAREHPSSGTQVGLLKERFDAYKTNARSQFFDTHFADFDRQIVLVDVLSALHAGREAFEDTERAIAEIAAHLRYGISWLPFKKAQIRRVAFAATKADHVPTMRRENLKNLLRAMAERSRPSNSQLPVSYHAIASVLSTVDGTARIEGRPVEVVMGLPLGEERQRSFYPGDVPSGRPPESFWSDRFFELPVFAPPRIEESGAIGIPHLAIDEVMIELLKDVL